MENTVPQQSNNPMPQSVGTVPPPPGSTPSPIPPASRFPKQILVIAGIIVLLILGLLFFLLRNNTPSQGQYAFSIDGQQVQQEEVEELYTYYQSQDPTTYTRETSLNLIKELYVDNYLLRAEYNKANMSLTELEKKVKEMPTPSSLIGAPEKLIQLTKENTVLREELTTVIGVQERSAHMLTLGLLEEVSGSERASLEATMVRELNSYRAIMNENDFEEVKRIFLADPEITAENRIAQYANSFTDMPASHPSLPGEDFLEKVFFTPQQTASEVFKSESGSVVFYGIVYPTTPQIVGNYSDMREWLADKKTALVIEADFSVIQ